jgi:hypothetical protein
MSFEVFICYKELTGGPFAEKLREGLKEYGIKAFVAHMDIPAKYKFHEEWNEIRDQAIRECKTFVMIVTWLFESSPEIINEINLVKQYKDKDIMVFRRKQQSHDISIDLGNDILLALKNKEQIPFYDSADLINLFLDKYPRHEKQNIDKLTSNIPTNKEIVEKQPESAITKTTPLIHYEITQSIQNTIHKRSLPDVGFNIRNWNSHPLKAKVQARVILGGGDLGLIKGNKRMGKYLGYYDGKTPWNLNPYIQVFGHFTLPPEYSERPNDSLTIEVTVSLEDLNGEKFEYLPVCWTYDKEINDWFYEPTSDC